MATIDDLPGDWTVAYRSPARLSMDGQGYTSSITFQTTYYNLVAFMTVVGGTVQSVGSAGDWSINRRVPLEDPLYTGLYAVAASSETFGTPSETSTAIIDLWSHVRVTVEFSSVPYGVAGSDQPYMTMSARAGGVYTTQQGRKFAFSNGEILGQEAGTFNAQTNYTITLYQCPTIADDVLDGLLNKRNSTTFLGKPAGQMLFQGWGFDYQVAIGGGFNYTKQLFVTYQDHDWNTFYRSDGVMDTPTDPDGNPPYPDSADLNIALQN